MTTEDIKVPSDKSWTAITPIGKNVIIYNGTNILFQVRLGDASTSYGMELVPEGTVIADQTIYIASQQLHDSFSGSLRVTR